MERRFLLANDSYAPPERGVDGCSVDLNKCGGERSILSVQALAVTGAE